MNIHKEIRELIDAHMCYASSFILVKDTLLYTSGQTLTNDPVDWVTRSALIENNLIGTTDRILDILEQNCG